MRRLEPCIRRESDEILKARFEAEFKRRLFRREQGDEFRRA